LLDAAEYDFKLADQRCSVKRHFPRKGLEMKQNVARSFLIALGILNVQAAWAADVSSSADTADAFAASISLGHLSGVAHELVYNPDGSKLSELIWDMDHALVANGGLSWQATERLKLYGNFSLGLAADSYMDDYDWEFLSPPAEPNLHSWHDETELDHYYSIDLGLGYLLHSNGTHDFSILGGFKHTSIKWTALGGCYNYDGDEGCFNDGDKVISYRLSLPAPYMGLGYLGEFDRWALSLEGRAGMTLSSAEGEDDHWLTGVNFVDELESEPYVALSGKAAYSLTEKADLVGSVAYDKFFRMRGETTTTNTSSGEVSQAGYDSGGADLYTLNIAVGLNYRF
jgi:omptin